MLKPITSSKVVQTIGNTVSNGCAKLGHSICERNGGKLDKFLNKIEPTGANNSFYGMASLMAGMVILPRVITASRRNPDNKEATKDEIIEILFRDLQTVTIILFALKAFDALIGRGVTHFKGLPMTSKPFDKVFETTAGGLQGVKEKTLEFVKHPVKKLGIIGKNILDTLNPIGGVRKYTNKEFQDNYSGYTTINGIKKMYENMKNNGGKPDKIFDEVMDSIIKDQEKTMANQAKITNAGYNAVSNTASKVLEGLKQIKEKGLSGLEDEKLDENVKNSIISFHKNPENMLVKKGKSLSALTRTFALGVETFYLGFGLPALNQMRLEKKYLKETGGKKITYKEQQVPMGKSFIKKFMPSEAKIYKNFIEK